MADWECFLERPTVEVQPEAVVLVGVLLPDGLVSYGQPARGAGASVVSSRPEGGPVNMFSGPLHC